jgi:beta-glucanase (GH16 family)
MRWTVVASAAVAVLALAVCDGTAPSAVAAGQVASPAVERVASSSVRQWEKVWGDEFDGTGFPEGWKSADGNGENGWSHESLHYNLARNARRNGTGQLVITADREPASTRLQCFDGPCRYTSARIQTKGLFEQKYGRFEARMKLPVGKGIWPAFWMQRNDPYGEIDVVETVGHRPRIVYGAAHASLGVWGRGQKELPESFADDYHVYSAEWDQDRIVWSVDGTPYGETWLFLGWPLGEPLYLILNVQVGGIWPGPPDAGTPFPARMMVDWVRVYRPA